MVVHVTSITNFGRIWNRMDLHSNSAFVFSVEHPDMLVFIQSNTGITPEKVATAIAGLLAYIYNRTTSDSD